MSEDAARGRSQRRRTLASLAALGLIWAAAAVAAPGPDADWAELSSAQRAALAPLQSEWAAMDSGRRESWLELAERFPSMPAAERQRLQARMAAWARLSPADRGQTRLQFQEAQRWSPEERQSRWEAYQSLHPQARKALAERWKLEAAAQARPQAGANPVKRNLVEPAPPRAAPPTAASPTSVRAGVGATTQPMLRPGEQPPYHQPGLPKIVATDAFVDPVTLLPRRGPQGAAATPAPKPTRPASTAKPRRP